MTNAKLYTLLNVTYYTKSRDHRKEQTLNELTPQDLDSVREQFSDLILRTPVAAAGATRVAVPPSLEQLFSTVEDIPLGIDLFTNGAGKSFTANLLLLPHTRTSRYHVRVSTTDN